MSAVGVQDIHGIRLRRLAPRFAQSTYFTRRHLGKAHSGRVARRNAIVSAKGTSGKNSSIRYFGQGNGGGMHDESEPRDTSKERLLVSSRSSLRDGDYGSNSGQIGRGSKADTPVGTISTREGGRRHLYRRVPSCCN